MKQQVKASSKEAKIKEVQRPFDLSLAKMVRLECLNRTSSKSNS